MLPIHLNRESDKLQDKRKELNHEVDNLKRTLVKQLNLTTAERKRIESSLSDERQLVLDLVEFRAALQEITRITSLKTIERDNKAREYLKAEVCAWSWWWLAIHSIACFFIAYSV